MFNLITHKINAEYSDYLYTYFLFETNGSAKYYLKDTKDTLVNIVMVLDQIGMHIWL